MEFGTGRDKTSRTGAGVLQRLEKGAVGGEVKRQDDSGSLAGEVDNSLLVKDAPEAEA